MTPKQPTPTTRFKLLTSTNIALAGALALMVFVCTIWFAGGLHEVQGWANLRGFHDWDYQEGFHRAIQHSLNNDQFPLWNPYMNGGVPLWADSQVGFTPLNILMQITGVSAGMKMLFFATPIIAALTMFFLLREQQRTALASIVGALLFAFGGSIIVRLWAGHHNMIPLMWFPLLLLFYERSRTRTTRYCIAAAGVIALMLFSGGNYIVIFSALFLGVYATFLALQQGKLKPLILVGAILIITVGLGAIKILPTLELAQFAGIRQDIPQPTPPLGHIWNAMVTQFDADIMMVCYDRVCLHEYASYIGWAPMILCALYLFVQLARKKSEAQGLSQETIALIATAGILFLIALGDTSIMQSTIIGPAEISQRSLWDAISKLPVLRSQDYSVRYLMMVSTSIIILTAEAMTYFETRAKQHETTIARWGAHNILKIVLLVIFILDLRFAADYYLKPFRLQVVGGEKAATFQQRYVKTSDSDYNDLQAENLTRALVAATVRNFGTVNIHNPSTERMPHIIGTIDETENPYYGEQYLASGKGEVVLKQWTPNKLIFNVKANNERDTLVVNQNFFPGWTTQEQGKAFPYHPTVNTPEKYGLIGIHTVQGEQTIILEYKPQSFYYGASISALTMLCVLLILFSDHFYFFSPAPWRASRARTIK